MDLFILLFTNMISAVGITIVAPILGIASNIFNVDQGYAMWLMTGFMLTYVAFMPMAGRMSDIFGRKRMFTISTLIFSMGLFLSFLTEKFNLVVVGRMVQGFGAGGILPVVNAMVVEIHPDKKEKMLALVNATYGLGMILGVNLGGILFDSFGWRWIFVLPFLLTIVAFVSCVIFLRKGKKGKEEGSVDYLGSGLFALSVAGFMLGMRNLSNHSLISPEVLTPFIVTVVSAILFILVEMKVKDPMMDIRIFRKFSFSLYNIVSFFFGFSMFLSVTFLPSYIQLSFGYSVSQSVYAINPFAISMIFSAIIGGVMMTKIGGRKTMLFGSILLSVFSIIFTLIHMTPVSFYITSILLGFGLGISMTPMNHIVMEEGGRENQGRSAGIVSIMRSMGGIIGPTLAGFLISRIDFSSFFVMDELLRAYRRIFSMVSVSAILMVILSVLGLLSTKKFDGREDV
ncbi:MAG: MFS transporter [Thermotogae bacterium]|nr:MFS transporter [Thermotogota bacterium]